MGCTQRWLTLLVASPGTAAPEHDPAWARDISLGGVLGICGAFLLSSSAGCGRRGLLGKTEPAGASVLRGGNGSCA